MNKKEILASLKGLELQIENLINEVNKIEEPLSISDDEQTKNDGFAYKVIKTFILENGTLLDKERQHNLFNKLHYCNWRRLSLIKLMRELNIKFNYIQDTTKVWKDIEIIEFYEEIKAIEDLNS